MRISWHDMQNDELDEDETPTAVIPTAPSAKVQPTATAGRDRRAVREQFKTPRLRDMRVGG